MSEETPLCFGPFRLDLANEGVWRGQEALKLTRRVFTVLRYLVEHPGRLVTKEELFQAVWPEVVVGDAALTVSVREIRQILGDTAKPSQYIETVYGRGYRFIAAVTAAPVSSFEFRVSSSLPPPTPGFQPLAPTLVGREAELVQLQQWFDQAASGQRQIVFVTGEPGIGKTTVVEAFLDSLNPKSQRLNPAPWVGRGQCIDHHGAGEAYMPILEALGRLCRAPGGDHFITLLSQYAPTWLAQMPTLLSTDGFAALQPKVQGATRERMLREMAEALEVLTAERPLVLVLEDLHWSDPSTLDLLSLVARRREPARLLVIGTYRPSEVFATDHPLRTVIQELLGHQQCQERALEGLSEVAVEEYLDQRFPVRMFPSRLAQVLHQRTEGNPLFLVNLVDELVTHNILTDGEGGWMVHGEIEELVQQVPDTSRQLIAAQIARVSPATQQTLAAASVAATIFSAAAVAAALETPIPEVETRCEDVVRQQLFLQRAGIEAWPDGTEAARYGFRHALYQELWHGQGTINQRQEWHQRIGLRKEVAYNGRAAEIAAELAVHFEQGRDTRRAIHYLQQAAQNASARSANREAIQHLTKGLELLKTLPDTPERTRQELDLQMALGTAFMAIKGYAAPEVANAYARARELARGVEEAPRLASLFYGLWVLYLVRGEIRTAHEVAQQFMRLAQRVQDPTLLMEAHHALGQILHFMGDFSSALAHLEQNLALYNPQQHSPAVRRNVQDLGVMGRCYAAWSLWYLGYPDQALTRSDEALALAQEVSHPFSLAFALSVAASVRLHRKELQLAQEWAEALITFATKQGFSLLAMVGATYRGQALAEQGDEEEGIAQVRQALAAYGGAGAKLGQPRVLSVLGKAHGKIGQPGEGLSLLAEALMIADKNEDRRDEAELYRLKGELTLAHSRVQSLGSSVKKSSKSRVQSLRSSKPKSQSLNPDPQGEAEAYFLKAIEIARHQQAKSLELRATVSLVGLWQQQGKKTEAHQMLSEVYNWFTEGFDTKDLQEAKALLESLT